MRKSCLYSFLPGAVSLSHPLPVARRYPTATRYPDQHDRNRIALGQCVRRHRVHLIVLDLLSSGLAGYRNGLILRVANPQYSIVAHPGSLANSPYSKKRIRIVRKTRRCHRYSCIASKPNYCGLLPPILSLYYYQYRREN